MSYDAQFKKAEEIVKSLPPTGKVQPSQDQKLDVSSSSHPQGERLLIGSSTRTSSRPTRETSTPLDRVRLHRAARALGDRPA